MRTAWVISPLGDADSVIRRRSNWLMEKVIVPELTNAGYNVGRAAWSRITNAISQEVSHHLYAADLVIADVTDGNASVMYELGRRHAWGMHCLLVATADTRPESLPFGIRHLPIIMSYEQTNDATMIEDYRTALGAHVAEITTRPHVVSLGGSEEGKREVAKRLAAASGLSFLVSRLHGAEDHYKIAQRLMARPVKRLFLMQRSSSLILGPEQGWDWERRFYKLLLEKVGEGTNLYHLVSLEGIARHLKRRTSTFPEAKSFGERLNRIRSGQGSGAAETAFTPGDIVGLAGIDGRANLFRKLPPEGEESMKPDRQARTLIAEFEDGTVEGLLVADLGSSQSAFLLSGPEMERWLEECIDYYHRCEYLYWQEVEATINPA